MSLRDRLDWAYQLGRPKERARPQAQRDELPQLPWGEVVTTPFGTCVRIVENYPLELAHGRFLLRELYQRQPHTFGALDRRARVSYALVDELCFLDTETTGLAGGVGTVPFLIGVGYFTQDSFVIEQYFARDFDEEPAALHLAHRILQQRAKWVSYNGKAFDAQLINHRLLFHRLAPPLEPQLHVDLLFTVRRFWKHRLGECSLSRAEQELLGVSRETDVPSYLVPQIYFAFLRNRDPGPLEPILHHNRQDILSLVGLLDAAAKLLEVPTKAPGEPDWRQAPRLLLQRGRLDQAARVLEAMLESETQPRMRKALLMELAHIMKRRERWEEAVRLWEEALRLPGFSLDPYVELAKFYEHRARQLDRAEHYTRRALEQIRTVAVLRPDARLAQQERHLRLRLRRIVHKQNRHAGPGEVQGPRESP